MTNLEKGGVQRTAQNFAEAFHDLGHDSRVLALAGGIRREQLEAHGIDVTIGLGERGLERLEAWSPHVIHLHDHLLEEHVVEHVLSRMPKALVVEKNVFSIPSAWSASVDYSHQLSTWCLWLYNRRARSRPGAPTVIVPNPIDASAFAPSSARRVDLLRRRLGMPSDALVIGRIGQSFLSKWSVALVSIFEQLAVNERLYLLLVNPPREMIEAASKSTAAERVRIIDRIDDDVELTAAYTLIDVFVHVAEGGESFGNVLLEAQLCETPIVTWSTPWADNSQIEVVSNGVGGFVATHRRGFLDATALLLRDDELRHRMGKAGRAWAQRFDRRVVAQQIVDLVRQRRAQSLDSPQLECEVDKLYRSSYDPPTWLERRVLFNGSARVRLLLKYLSGFKPWTHLLSRPIILPLRVIRGTLKREGTTA